MKGTLNVNELSEDDAKLWRDFRGQVRDDVTLKFLFTN
jgi:hypothetical protein